MHLLSVLFLSAVCIFSVSAAENRVSEENEAKRKLVYTLFEAQRLPEQISSVIRNVVKLQIASVPDLVPYTESLTAFLDETSGYHALKKDLSDIYLSHFTETDIRAYIAFYRTAEGRKMAEQSESIFRQTSALIQSRLRENSEKLLKRMQSVGNQQGSR